MENNSRIKEFVDELFTGVKQTDRVVEQKEELLVNLTERVKDYMSKGLSFGGAFEAAKFDIGNIDELTSGFEKEKTEEPAQKTGIKIKLMRYKGEITAKLMKYKWEITALTPFIYLFLGLLFGWWAWAWVIFPIVSIIYAPMSNGVKLVSLSPFIYVVLGFVFGAWAWGWIIIPVSGILCAGKNLR